MPQSLIGVNLDPPGGPTLAQIDQKRNDYLRAVKQNGLRDLTEFNSTIQDPNQKVGLPAFAATMPLQLGLEKATKVGPDNSSLVEQLLKRYLTFHPLGK